MDVAGFLEEFNRLESADERLRLCVDGMGRALAQEGSADFRAFWEVRGLCAPLFKEAINPALRSHLWGEYRDLTREARRLKEMVNQEASFTGEQFELAIAALSQGLSGRNFPLDPELPKRYVELQGELDQLDSGSERLQSLRKELALVQIRHKGRLFETLSQIGDRLYPRRKELIQEVSALFEADVNEFVQRHFSGDVRTPLHRLRDEIKALQGLAKRLTLNARSFSRARLRLSECWDQVREEGRKRKQHRAEKLEASQARLEALVEQLIALGERIDDPAVKVEESSERLHAIAHEIERVAPQKEEREEVRKVRQKLATCVKVEQETKAARLEELRSRLEGPIESEEEVEQLARELALSSLSPSEQQAMEQRLTAARDRFERQREAELLSGEVTLETLEKVLSARRRRRREVKQLIDGLRRKGGASGLDFEQALVQQEKIEENRHRLEEVDQLISQLERQIAERGE